MVAITPLRALAVIFAGLAASCSALAQQTDTSDPSVEAAIYHAAGNSTKVSSDIVITDPTEKTIWYAQDKVSIGWTGTTPTQFAFQIINEDSSVKASGMTLLADAQTSAGTASSNVGNIESGSYFVRLYDPTDISKQIAISPVFTVKPKSEKVASNSGNVTEAVKNSNDAVLSNASTDSTVNHTNSTTSTPKTSANASFGSIQTGEMKKLEEDISSQEFLHRLKRFTPPTPQPAPFPVMKKKDPVNQRALHFWQINKKKDANRPVKTAEVKNPRKDNNETTFKQVVGSNGHVASATKKKKISETEL